MMNNKDGFAHDQEDATDSVEAEWGCGLNKYFLTQRMAAQSVIDSWASA